MYTPITSWSNRERKDNYKGYQMIYVPEHPFNHKGWVYEHRLVMEAHIGRVLKKYETVHHINEVKSDNDWKNLFVCTRVEHNRAHLTLAKR